MNNSSDTQSKDNVKSNSSKNTVSLKYKAITLPAFLFMVLGSIIFSGYYFYSFCITPFNPSSMNFVNIEIKKGESLKQIAYKLAKNRIITKPRMFVYLTMLKGLSNKVKAGEYRVSGSMYPLEILNIIITGKVVLHPVTIPEGLNTIEIMSILDKKQLIDKEKYIELLKDKSLLKLFKINAESLEGYLFPETYFFSKDSSELTIIKTMVTRFYDVFTEEKQKRAKELGLTVHQVVTLASIIEKETALDNEKPLVSSVFHNRLKRHMKLQSDPTVIYALKDFSGNIRKKDLLVDSPFNTYRYRGLPPGPIASPGEASLNAVIYPAHTSFLYFVSKNNGSHKFSNSIKEHNKAVRQYQLSRHRKRARKKGH